METYPLTIIDGHPVAEIGGRWFLVDTGSHATFGEGGTVTILGEEIPYQRDLLGIVSIGDVNQYVHTRIQAILGADVLAKNYFAFDLEHRRFNISREPLPFEGTPLEVELILGVPFTRTTVAGTGISTVLDTGATICFLEPEHVDGLDSVGRKRDFFPTMGHFETEVYRSTIEFAGRTHTMKTGVLPETLRAMLRAVGVKAIIGTELFNYYDVCFALPENKIYLKPRPSRQAVRVEVSIEYYGITELQHPWTDSELVQQILSANPVASERFFDQYKRLIYSTLIKYCGIKDDMLEDAWQHVCMKLLENNWQRLKLWRGRSKLSTFLVAVVINLGHDFREREIDRHRRRQVDQDPVDDPPGTKASDFPDPERYAIMVQISSVVGGLISLLEEVCQRLIHLKFNQEMSYLEIAEVTGLTLSNVGVKLHRCMEGLRRLVKEELPDIFDAPLREFDGPL